MGEQVKRRLTVLSPERGTGRRTSRAHLDLRLTEKGRKASSLKKTGPLNALSRGEGGEYTRKGTSLCWSKNHLTSGGGASS